MTPQRIAVVGTGIAGLTVLRELRRLGYDGELIVVGDETGLPVDRPPLSKHVLTGAWPLERAQLIDAEEWRALNLIEHLGVPAAQLHTDPVGLTLAGGGEVVADAVVIATGVQPRLPGFARGVGGVSVLRDAAHAVRLREEVANRRLVVIGAGFLGLEVAASALTLGSQVTVVSPQPMLAGILTSDMSARLEGEHRELGSVIEVPAEVGRLETVDGEMRAVCLTDGRSIETDHVLIAIGATPGVAWLEGSGLDLTDGVVVDHRGRGAENVFACGDVSSWPHPTVGRVRVEHRLTAQEQASVVAHQILGLDAAWNNIPFWWSDQGSAVRLQGYGDCSAQHDVEVIDGAIDEGRFVAAYRRDGQVVGLLGWNNPKGLRQRRSLLGTGVLTSTV